MAPVGKTVIIDSLPTLALVFRTPLFLSCLVRECLTAKLLHVIRTCLPTRRKTLASLDTSASQDFACFPKKTVLLLSPQAHLRMCFRMSFDALTKRRHYVHAIVVS